MFNDHGCGYPVFGQINHKLGASSTSLCPNSSGYCVALGAEFLALRTQGFGSASTSRMASSRSKRLNPSQEAWHSGSFFLALPSGFFNNPLVQMHHLSISSGLASKRRWRLRCKYFSGLRCSTGSFFATARAHFPGTSKRRSLRKVRFTAPLFSRLAQSWPCSQGLRRYSAAAPNPSINRTCPGKPGHAGYLKR